MPCYLPTDASSTVIDGCRPHCVMPFTGERYALVYFVHNSNSGITRDKVAEMELRKLKFRAPDRRCLALLRAGCGIYSPVVTEGPDDGLHRRFVLPPNSDCGAAPLTGAAQSQDDVRTVGADCCGLLVEWEATHALLGSKARLVWASDSQEIRFGYVFGVSPTIVTSGSS